MDNYANDFGITKGMIADITKGTCKHMRDFRKTFTDKNKVNLSNKLISELVGKVFEAQCTDIFTKKLGYEVKREMSDSDPDLFFIKIERPLEVKLTSTKTGWRGGEFSKRPFDYLLVSWGGDFDEYFICLVRLTKKDWHSNIARGYYAPDYKADKLYKRKDKVVFLGSFNKTDRGAIHLVREKIRFG